MTPLASKLEQPFFSSPRICLSELLIIKRKEWIVVRDSSMSEKSLFFLKILRDIVVDKHRYISI